jgi:hypothetical protein
MNQPTYAGIWRVIGHRFTSRRRMRVAVNDIVDVQEVDFVRPKRLAVYFFGRANPYSLDVFEADWQPVRIDFGGERCS